MNLEALINEKMRQLETLKAKLQEIDNYKQKLTVEILEAQGATKQLVELVNLQKVELKSKSSSVVNPTELVEAGKGKRTRVTKIEPVKN